MQFLDTSKGLENVVPADSPLNSPAWVVSTIHTYIFKSEWSLIIGSGEIIRIDIPKIFNKEYQGNLFSSYDDENGANL